MGSRPCHREGLGGPGLWQADRFLRYASLASLVVREWKRQGGGRAGPFYWAVHKMDDEFGLAGSVDTVSRRRAASRAPIDHMLATFGLWVFVSTAPASPREISCHHFTMIK